jgi:pterin-4a-carbinolamine dehydratase
MMEVNFTEPNIMNTISRIFIGTTKILTMEKLTDREIEDKMSTIYADWIHEDSFLKKEFVFENFITAFGFMTSVAMVAEKADHHPHRSGRTARFGLSNRQKKGTQPGN